MVKTWWSGFSKGCICHESWMQSLVNNLFDLLIKKKYVVPDISWG